MSVSADCHGFRYVQRLTRRAERTEPSIDVLSNLQAMRVLMVDQVCQIYQLKNTALFGIQLECVL
jgi:hypothetical protein